MTRYSDCDLYVLAAEATTIVRRLIDQGLLGVTEIAIGAGLSRSLIEGLATGTSRFILSASYGSLLDYYTRVTCDRAERGLRWSR